jgi:hypothetical protein
MRIKWDRASDIHRRKKDHDSVKFGVHMKLVRPIKICLNETYRKVRICKYFTVSFLIKNSLKQGDSLSALLFNFPSDYAIR